MSKQFAYVQYCHKHDVFLQRKEKKMTKIFTTLPFYAVCYLGANIKVITELNIFLLLKVFSSLVFFISLDALETLA